MRRLKPLEVQAQRGERAGDREEVRRDRRPGLVDLGCLIAGGPVDRAVQVADPVHAAEVDELQRGLRLDDVVELEVAEQQARAVQVAERRQDLEHVGDRLRDGQRVGDAAVGLASRGEQILEAQPADVLHDDVARAVALDEVDDLHDVRVLDLGEKQPLGERRRHRLLVAGVQQALQDDPAVGDVAVLREVDPAQAAMREAADDLVLLRDDLAGAQLRREREGRAAMPAEPIGPAGLVTAPAPDRAAAAPAEAPALRDPRVGHDGVGRVAQRHLGHLDEAGSKVRARGRARARRSAPAPRRGRDDARAASARRSAASSRRARRGPRAARRRPRGPAPCRSGRSSRRRACPSQPGCAQVAGVMSPGSDSAGSRCRTGPPRRRASTCAACRGPRA